MRNDILMKRFNSLVYQCFLGVVAILLKIILNKLLTRINVYYTIMKKLSRIINVVIKNGERL